MNKILLVGLAATVLLTGCSTVSRNTIVSEVSLANKSDKIIFIMAGKVEASEKADIASKISAKVAEIKVDIGSAVKKGDVLVKLDTKDIEAQAAQAEAAVAAAQANLNKALNGSRQEQVIQAQAAFDNIKNTYDRMNALYQQGAASKQQLENAELQFLNAQEQLAILKKDSPDNIKVLEAQVKQAQAASDIVRTQLNNGILTAPISGVVSSKNVNVGELAAVGTVTVSIVNGAGLFVQAYLPVSLLSQVKEGQEVAVKFSDISQKEFKGEIEVVNAAIDPKGKNVLVKARLKDPDSSIKPGMFAEIGIRK